MGSVKQRGESGKRGREELGGGDKVRDEVREEEKRQERGVTKMKRKVKSKTM